MKLSSEQPLLKDEGWGSRYCLTPTVGLRSETPGHAKPAAMAEAPLLIL